MPQIDPSDLDAMRAKIVAAERERCAKIAEEWMDQSTMKLRAGEMTAQELRTSRAVVAAISRAIRNQ